MVLAAFYASGDSEGTGIAMRIPEDSFFLCPYCSMSYENCLCGTDGLWEEEEIEEKDEE